MHPKTSSSDPDLHPVDASSTPLLPAVTTKNVSRPGQMSAEGQTLSFLGNAAPSEEDRNGGCSRLSALLDDSSNEKSRKLMVLVGSLSLPSVESYFRLSEP